MTLYLGETLTIVAQAVDPKHNTNISDATGEVEFYLPGKSPATVPADRAYDRGPYDMEYDELVQNKDGTFGAYVAYVDTASFGEAGKWTYKVTLTGVYDTWEYGTVALKP